MAKKIRSPEKKTPNKLGFSLGVFIVLLAFALMGLRVLIENLPSQAFVSRQAPTSPQVTKNPAGQLPETSGLPEVAVEVPVRAFNPRMGRIDANTEIIIFGHLACADCAHALNIARNYAKEHPMALRLVSKFAMLAKTQTPKQEEQAIEAGLFAAIANDERLFWRALDQLGEAQTPHRNQLLKTLGMIGVSHTTLREKLHNNSNAFMQQIEQDLKDFKGLHTSRLPAVIINGKLLRHQQGLSLNEHLRARLNALKDGL